VKLSFCEEAVSLETVELKASGLAEESTLTAPDSRGYGRAAQDGQERTHALRKQGVVEATGRTEGGADPPQRPASQHI
jgi:hypothetical protein